MAASNSAEVEKLALGAGMKKGGAAKGELVLAMYELANCFRNGWGIKKDPAAAKQYYETAANLGDTDAMNEVAWCYIEGFGTKKDKVRRPLRCVRQSLLSMAPSCLDRSMSSRVDVDAMVTRTVSLGSRMGSHTASTSAIITRLYPLRHKATLHLRLTVWASPWIARLMRMYC